jgi:hypothetical protein
MGLYDFDLDPNAPSWQLAIERDATERFTGPASTRPFGAALYLWGDTAIYGLRFGRWTPLSAATAAERLLEAHREVRAWLPNGHLALYIQLPADLPPPARTALADALTALPLTTTTVLIGTLSADWERMVMWRVIGF